MRRDSVAQIHAAKKELHELFPWLDFSAAQFTSFFVDRAEARQPDEKRPDSCFVKDVENTITAWPTKLAFAPKVADEVIAILQANNIKPTASDDLHLLRAWPIPAFSKPIWDEFL